MFSGTWKDFTRLEGQSLRLRPRVFWLFRSHTESDVDSKRVEAYRVLWVLSMTFKKVNVSFLPVTENDQNCGLSVYEIFTSSRRSGINVIQWELWSAFEGFRI